MWLNVVFLLYALNMLAPNSTSLKVIEVSQGDLFDEAAKVTDYKQRPQSEEMQQNPSHNPQSAVVEHSRNIIEGKRRFRHGEAHTVSDEIAPIAIETDHDTRKAGAKNCDDPKEKTLKDKIDRLVEQTIEDAERKMATIADIKEHGKEQPPYKIGFILNMVKKSREVQNELFNVAVKHRDDWRSLEQMKIFELMVHTNVDTTNLVRQMVEIHVQHSNVTHVPYQRKRVVLLR